MHQLVAKGSCGRCPSAEACSHKIGYHPTQISLLSRVVVGSCVIAGDGHGPTLVTVIQALEKTGGVFDIEMRVEHVADAVKFGRVVMVIDLHAAEIDQLLSLLARSMESMHGLCAVPGVESPAFNVEGKGLEAAFHAGFGKAYSVENPWRNRIFLRCCQDFSFAWIWAGKCARGSDAKYRCCQYP